MTKGEFTRFSIKGRMQLLTMYGKVLLRTQLDKKQLSLYILFDFYVAVISSRVKKNIVISAEPLTHNMAQFYLLAL